MKHISVNITNSPACFKGFPYRPYLYYGGWIGLSQYYRAKCLVKWTWTAALASDPLFFGVVTINPTVKQDTHLKNLHVYIKHMI